jgi:hypothetical protein
MADGHELAVHVREQMRAAVSNVRAGLSADVLAVDELEDDELPLTTEDGKSDRFERRAAASEAGGRAAHRSGR